MKLSTEAKISVGSCAALAGIFILGFVSYQSTREIGTALFLPTSLLLSQRWITPKISYSAPERQPPGGPQSAQS
jgi:hypothetical protein